MRLKEAIEAAKELVDDAGLFMGHRGDRLRDRIFTGHARIGSLTIYGANAMHYAVNVRTRRGWFCAHPTTGIDGYWPWYAYISEDATPQGASWGIGPGFDP